jgi:hypothetical protein
MQVIALLMLVAIVSARSFGQTESEQTTGKPTFFKGREVVFDTDTLIPDRAINPYSVLASQNSWTKPVLDHTGKPHHHGHLIQIIVDGGNGIQDPPNADGSPGGDDSLAYANFNMIRMRGSDEPYDLKGATGMFASWRFFVPFVPPPRAYYLRIWEGDNVATAPYYQNTIEYKADTNDRGGAMIVLRSGPPIEVDWTFGPSKPRPTGVPDPKK